MNKLLVNTPQNVQIAYTIAPFTRRMGAFIIDVILQALLIFGVVYTVNSFRIEDQWNSSGFTSLLIFPIFMYPFICELLMNGQTVGKWAVNIRVVRLDGQRATFYNYFLRWVIGFVEIWVFSFIPAFLSTILTKNNQRIGDLAANTGLIDLRPKLNLSQTIFEDLADNYAITFPQVERLSDRDINIVNENFQRALKTDNYDVFEAFTRKLEEIMQVESDGMGFKKFIQLVLQDHYHFHKDK